MREIAIRCWARALRYYTFERDDGICESCALDTVWLRQELDDLRGRDREAWIEQLAELGCTRKEGRKSLWHAHHRVPVDAGGGACGLEGVETLCIRCHKRLHRRDLVPTKRVKKPTTRPTRFREKGLWLSATTVKVEDVRKAHRTPCIDCERSPKKRRLLVRKGPGRGAVSEVYCIDCGSRFLRRMVLEGDRAMKMLTTGQADSDNNAIRLASAQFERVKHVHKQRAEERRRRKEAPDE